MTWSSSIRMRWPMNHPVFCVTPIERASCVYVSVDVLDGVVDDFVGVEGFQPIVRQ